MAETGKYLNYNTLLEKVVMSLALREPVKNVLADFARKGGRGCPPIPLRKKSFFFHTDFPLRGGVPPNSVKEKIR